MNLFDKVMRNVSFKQIKLCVMRRDLCHCRHCQQGAAVSVHHGDAAEDVQSGSGSLLRGILQPFWLFRGVRGHHWNHPGGTGDHASSGDLCAAMCPPAQDLQGDTVRIFGPSPVTQTSLPLSLMSLSVCAAIGQLCPTWWHRCWTRWSPSPHYCSSSSSFSSSSLCSACSCLEGSSTSMRRRPNAALSTPSHRHCSPASR